MPRRRTIPKMLLLLLAWGAAGATLNVAVAWGFGLSRPNPYFVPTKSGGERLNAPNDGRLSEAWEIGLWQGRGLTVITSEHVHYLGQPGPDGDWDKAREPTAILPHWAHMVSKPPWPTDTPRTGWTRYYWYTGWPRLSLWCEPNRNPRSIRGGIDLGDPMDDDYLPRILPYRPLWHGFAVNTLFYAGVLWVLFCGPLALRRMIRRRRGQCPACAYPIGQSPVCTECGAELGKRQLAMGNGAKE